MRAWNPGTRPTGAAALALAEEWRPDLVVLDLMLPGIDGLEVCRRLRKAWDDQAPPVIMLTALGEENDRVLGLETGADDYVTKPFSPRELALRVQAVLRRAGAPLAPEAGVTATPPPLRSGGPRDSTWRPGEPARTGTSWP